MIPSLILRQLEDDVTDNLQGNQTLIDNHINGFNTQNIELFLSIFGDTAIIIDGIAPYRWLNPNAPTKWLADVEKWREILGSRTSTCRTS